MALLNKLVKLELRPLLARCSATWSTSSQQNAVGSAYSHLDLDYEEQHKGISPESRDELVTLRFRAGCGALMAPYKRILIGKLFSKLLNTTAGYLTGLSEKGRWSLSTPARIIKPFLTLQGIWLPPK